MKKLLLVLIFLPSLLIAQTKAVKINVNLSRMPDSLFFYLNDGENNLDSAWSKNETLNFTYNKQINDPKNVAFIARDKKHYYTFWIDDTDISLKGSFDNFYTIAVTGSQTDNEFKEMLRLTAAAEDSLSVLKLQLDEYKARKLPDTAKYMNQIRNNSEKLKAIKSEFIRLHPKSVISTRLLAIETRKKNFTKAESLELFTVLNPDQQNSHTGQMILKSVNSYANPVIGDTAPLFTMNANTGKSVSLAQFKGHPVLLVFWATWCAPCLEEIPAIKKMYERYKSKGLIVLAVSLDNKRDSWINYIKKEKLPWIHLNDLEAWSNKAALIYGVTTIPENFIIDRAGKLIYKGYVQENLELKMKEMFQ